MRTPNASLITIAADAEVADVRRYAADLAFPILVDVDNELAKVLRYRAIPNGYCFGPDGTLLDELVTRFDIREPAVVDLVRSWLEADFTAERPQPRPGLDDATARALEIFAEGTMLRARGERDRGLALWHAAYLLDPKSFVIRKQVWRALYPERFGERIDLEWQREQMGREDELGFSAANPTLPRPEASEALSEE